MDLFALAPAQMKVGYRNRRWIRVSEGLGATRLASWKDILDDFAVLRDDDKALRRILYQLDIRDRVVVYLNRPGF
jgi:hypothetical protein